MRFGVGYELSLKGMTRSEGLEYVVLNDESLSSGVTITIEYLVLSGRFGRWPVIET
jgi:hypothetical protein